MWIVVGLLGAWLITLTAAVLLVWWQRDADVDSLQAEIARLEKKVDALAAAYRGDGGPRRRTQIFNDGA